MELSATLDSRDYTIPAGAVVIIHTNTGQLSCTGLTDGADVKVRINDLAESQLFHGLHYKAPEIDGIRRIELRNAGASPAVATLYLSRGDFADRRVTASSTLPVDPTAPGLGTVQDVSLAAGVTSQVLAAAADRREAIITNLDSTETLRIGDANAAADRGTPVGPGATLVLPTRAAIHAHNPGAGAVLVAVTVTTS